MKRLKVNGLEVNVISAEDLIISKLYRTKDSQSEMQLNDIRSLMKLEYDEKHVSNWITRLILKEIFLKV